MMKKDESVMKILVALFMLIISTHGALAASQDFNLPLDWILARNGTSVDQNLNGIVDFADDAFSLNGLISTDFLTPTDNTSIWNGINSKINTSSQGNLNVNSSTWWAGLNNWLPGWFFNSNNSLQWNETRLTLNYYNKTEILTLVNASSTAASNFSQYTNISNLQILNYSNNINSVSTNISNVNTSLMNEITKRTDDILSLNNSINSLNVAGNASWNQTYANTLFYAINNGNDLATNISYIRNDLVVTNTTVNQLVNSNSTTNTYINNVNASLMNEATQIDNLNLSLTTQISNTNNNVASVQTNVSNVNATLELLRTQVNNLNSTTNKSIFNIQNNLDSVVTNLSNVNTSLMNEATQIDDLNSTKLSKLGDTGNGNYIFTGAVNVSSGLRVNGSSSGVFTVFGNGVTGSGHLIDIINGNNNNTFTVIGSGLVGINQPSPAYALAIRTLDLGVNALEIKNNVSTQIFKVDTDASGNSRLALNLVGGATRVQLDTAGTSTFSGGGLTVSGGNLAVSGIYNLTTATGRVGIGTTTPQQALNVIGDANITGNIINFGYNVINTTLNTVSTKVDNINTTLELERTKINNLNSSLTSRDTQLQNNINSAQTNITNLNSSLTTSISNTNNNVVSVQTNITNLNSSLTARDTAINGALVNTNTTVNQLVSSNTTTNTYISNVNTTQNIMNLGFYNTSASDTRYLGGGYRIWYFYNDTDSTTGYKLAKALLPNATANISSITTSVAGNSEVNLSSWVTEPQNASYLALSGIRQLFMTARVSNTAQVTQLKGYIYTMNSTGGNITLLRTFTPSLPLTTVDTVYEMQGTGTTVEISPSTRILIVVSAIRTGATTYDVTISYDDNTLSRQQFPSPVGVTDLNALLIADATEQASRIGNDSRLSTNITNLNNSLTSQINNKVVDVLSANNFITKTGSTNITLAFQESQLNISLANYLATTYFNVSNVTVVTGTPQGSILNVNIEDNIDWNISEVNSDLNFTMNVTNITTFSEILIKYKSIPAEVDVITVSLWDISTNNYQSYDLLGGDSGGYLYKYINVNDPTNHILNGVVQIRFESINTGARTDKWGFDYVQLIKGFASASSTETDPLSVHKDGLTPLTGNWATGGFNITGTQLLDADDQRYNDTTKVNQVQANVDSVQSNVTILRANLVATNTTVNLVQSNLGVTNTTLNTVSTKVDNINTTLELERTKINNLNASVPKLSTSNTFTGDNIFTPLTNVTFNGNGYTLFYTPVVFFNSVNLSNVSSFNVNGSIVIRNIGNTVVGNWTDNNGKSLFWNDGNINNSGSIYGGSLYEGNISLILKYYSLNNGNSLSTNITQTQNNLNSLATNDTNLRANLVTTNTTLNTVSTKVDNVNVTLELERTKINNLNSSLTTSISNTNNNVASVQTNVTNVNTTLELLRTQVTNVNSTKVSKLGDTMTGSLTIFEPQYTTGLMLKSNTSGDTRAPNLEWRNSNNIILANIRGREIGLEFTNTTGITEHVIGINGSNTYFNLLGGNFGINTSTPQQTLNVVGSANITGNIINFGYNTINTTLNLVSSNLGVTNTTLNTVSTKVDNINITLELERTKINNLNSSLTTSISNTNNNVASVQTNITNLNSSLTASIATKALPGNCPAGQTVMNTTTSGVQCVSVGGVGTVTSITAGTGLTGGVITASGTIALNTTYSDGLYYSLNNGNSLSTNISNINTTLELERTKINNVNATKLSLTGGTMTGALSLESTTLKLLKNTNSLYEWGISGANGSQFLSRGSSVGANDYFYLLNSSSSATVGISMNNANSWIGNTGGNLGIGTSNPQQALNVVGSANITGNIINFGYNVINTTLNTVSTKVDNVNTSANILSFTNGVYYLTGNGNSLSTNTTQVLNNLVSANTNISNVNASLMNEISARGTADTNNANNIASAQTNITNVNTTVINRGTQLDNLNASTLKIVNPSVTGNITLNGAIIDTRAYPRLLRWTNATYWTCDFNQTVYLVNTGNSTLTC